MYENKRYDLLKARQVEGNLLVLGKHHRVSQLESTVCRSAPPKSSSLLLSEKQSVLKIALVVVTLFQWHTSRFIIIALAWSPGFLLMVSTPLEKQGGQKSTLKWDTPPLAVMSGVSTLVEIIRGYPAATDWWHDGLHVNAVWLGLAADSSACGRSMVTLICVTDQMEESKRLQENKNLVTHTHAQPLAYCWLTCSVMQCDCRWPAAVVAKAHSHYWEHWSSINPVRV